MIRQNDMNSKKSRYKIVKSMVLLFILITGLLSGFIGLVAFFGDYMGTFVISLDDNSYNLGIALSEKKSFANPTSRLSVNPVNRTEPTTFSDIDFKNSVLTDGNLKEKDMTYYIAYTFYIRNEGDLAVNIQLNLSTVEVRKNVDDCLRVAIIREGSVNQKGDLVCQSAEMFVKSGQYKDEVTYSYLTEKEKELYDIFTIREYDDSEKMGKYVLENLKPHEVYKYSLFIWVEGWDGDCGNNIKEGQIKMNLNFTIQNIYEEE